MKISRKAVLAMLAIIATLLLAYTSVSATHEITSGKQTIYVNGNRFEVWGYGGGGGNGSLHIRLRDLAYMLNGTPAQFNFRTTDDYRLHYWIIRGEAYEPDGTEFEPAYGYFLTGSLGFIQWEGLGHYPVQPAIIGLDGTDSPGAVILTPVYQDANDMFFTLHEMADFFGFDLDSAWSPEGVHYDISTANHSSAEIHSLMTLEYLDLITRISGHWIDQMYYYNPIIDETVVNPQEISISVHGVSDDTSFDARHTISTAMNWMRWAVPWWYPVSVLDNGFVEITVDFAGEIVELRAHSDINVTDETYANMMRFENFRIVVDANLRQIDEITLYVNDMPHHMVRYSWARQVFEYHATPSECGGITLRYKIRTGSFPLEFETSDIAVYRSHVFGERGERIFEQENVAFYDPLLFEFTDPTAEYGQVYYYALLQITDWGAQGFAHVVDNWMGQMRVDTSEVLDVPEPVVEIEVPIVEVGEPEPVPEPVPELEPVEILQYEETPRSRLAIYIAIFLVAGFVIFVAIGAGKRGGKR